MCAVRYIEAIADFTKVIEIDTTSHSVDEISNSIIDNFLHIIVGQNRSNELLQNVGKIDGVCKIFIHHIPNGLKI